MQSGLSDLNTVQVIIEQDLKTAQRVIDQTELSTEEIPDNDNQETEEEEKSSKEITDDKSAIPVDMPVFAGRKGLRNPAEWRRNKM